MGEEKRKSGLLSSNFSPRSHSQMKRTFNSFQIRPLLPFFPPPSQLLPLRPTPIRLLLNGAEMKSTCEPSAQISLRVGHSASPRRDALADERRSRRERLDCVFLGPGPDFEFRGFATLGHRLSSSSFFSLHRSVHPGILTPTPRLKLSPRTVFSRPNVSSEH